jgi:hypothetical protein
MVLEKQYSYNIAWYQKSVSFSAEIILQERETNR